MKFSTVLLALVSQTKAMSVCFFYCPPSPPGAEVCGTDGQTYGKNLVYCSSDLVCVHYSNRLLPIVKLC